MKFSQLVIVSLVILAAAASAATDVRAPDVVVERHLSKPGRMVRITLFDNRMAVTTVREGEAQVFFRQITLPQNEYEVYLDALAAVAQTAGVEAKARLDGDRIDGVVRISPPGFDARTFSYSPVQVLDLDTQRLISILDDLETRVASVSPSEETLRLWEPRVGERVLLFSGAVAVVTDVNEEGLLSLEHVAEGLIEIVPADRYSLVIERVLAEDEP